MQGALSREEEESQEAEREHDVGGQMRGIEETEENGSECVCFLVTSVFWVYLWEWLRERVERAREMEGERYVNKDY